jgi:hypothetical protein
MSTKSLPPEQQTLLDMAVNSSKKRFEELETDKNTVIFAGSKGGVSFPMFKLILYEEIFYLVGKVNSNKYFVGKK